MTASAMPRWPALREELRLHHGPADSGGQPSWTLQDPVRHRFLRLDWTTYEILRRWWLGDPLLIARQVSDQTTLNVGPADVLEVLQLAQREELVHPVQPPPRRPAVAGWQVALQWLLHHYLFFRIPLCRPDAWLARWLPVVRWLGHPRFTQATVLALLAGLVGLLQQREALAVQWVDLLSWRGVALYGATLCAVKLVHELGHAFTARAAGCRVPTMGVALMVLWPVAYTDTTEAWRLADARARLRIAAAGVRTELTLAAWATLAWCWLPDGPLRTALFVLATMTWVNSLLVNLSPFMRFDGYFLLCDLLDRPNLHERSFALARAWLRRTLLGWPQPDPETLAPAARRAFIAFALATWGYRLGLYLGIAWMVYHLGFKALGMCLAAVEFGWFIAGPAAREVRTWVAGRVAWRGSRRWRSSLAIGLALVGIGFVPWRQTGTGAALLQPAQHLAVRLPAAVVIDALPVTVGTRVRAGQTLIETSAPQWTQQLQLAQAKVTQLERELAAAALNADQQGQWPALQAALATAREQVDAAQQEAARFRPVAPFDGVVVDLNPGLRAGAMAPPPRETLMHLVSTGAWQAVAYVDEATARSLRPGDPASVGTDARPWQRWTARVGSVAAQPSAQLAEATLAQAQGGQVDARQTGDTWWPVQALYRVELSVEAPADLPLHAWRGHAVFAGEALSLWGRAWRQGSAAWVREAGF